MQFDFFRGNETEQYMFYRIPQVLFTDKKFKKISCEAKVLYGFLIDRTSLSVKNNWLDKSGNVFVYFTLEEAKEKLNIGTGKSVKIFDELEQIGLIIRKKQGQGNPTKIYVMNFTRQISKTSTQVDKDKVQTSKKRKSESDVEVKTSENRKSKVSKNGSVDFQKSKPNHTNRVILTESNQSYLSDDTHEKAKEKSESDGQTDLIENIRDDIKFQIDYDICLERLNELGITTDTLDLVVDILLEPYTCKSEMIVNSQPLSPQIVQAQFKKISFDHLQYIFDSLKAITQNHRIKNLRGYLRTCLYNAPHTIDQFYTNEANYDLNN